jgi:hypothetical protein
MARENTTGRKGVSLAKGPVAILGLAGIVYGVLGLILKGHGFALHIPHGTVHGRSWIGLEVNGWSDLLFIAAGLLLLFAAPLHWGSSPPTTSPNWSGARRRWCCCSWRCCRGSARRTRIRNRPVAVRCSPVTGPSPRRRGRGRCGHGRAPTPRR